MWIDVVSRIVHVGTAITLVGGDPPGDPAGGDQQGRPAGVPDADPASAEHDEPWPGGRSNHYLLDMNRDWFAMSQPETKGRITRKATSS